MTDAGGAPLVPVPLARGRHGAVVAPHHLATEAGLSVLRAGGHAVDAAIATNAAVRIGRSVRAAIPAAWASGAHVDALQPWLP